MNIENESGFVPVEYKVLVRLPDEQEKTEGGIYLPETSRQKEQQAAIRCRLIAVGGNAFSDPQWNQPIPRLGDRVMISKYAGQRENGVDGRVYALVNDKDIAAIILKEKNNE